MNKNEKIFEEIFENQLGLIKDKELTEKVVKCWAEAAEKGNWKTKEDILKIPFTLALEEQTNINLIEHTIAVTEAAYSMAKVEENTYGQKSGYISVNYDYLIAGGLLHDVGKPVEIEPDGKGYFRKSKAGKLLRHPSYGAAIGYKVGIPDEILNTIANHSSEGEGRPRTKETWLVMQADFAFFNPIKHKIK